MLVEQLLREVQVAVLDSMETPKVNQVPSWLERIGEVRCALVVIIMK